MCTRKKLTIFLTVLAGQRGRLSMGKNNIFDKLPDEKKLSDLDITNLSLVTIKAEPSISITISSITGTLTFIKSSGSFTLLNS